MAKEVDSIHLLSCAIEASLGNDFPAFAFRLPGDDGFYWGACEPDRLMTLADGVFPERQEGFFFAPFEEGELPRYFFPVKIQRAEEISLEALDYGAGQTLAKLEIKPVDSSFEQYEKQVNTLVAAMSRKEIKKAVLSRTVTSVSYTHLDVYKRQILQSRLFAIISVESWSLMNRYLPMWKPFFVVVN